MTVADRFWEKVDRAAGPDTCWPWMASRTLSGYGWFFVGKVPGRPSGMFPAHRVSYVMAHGPIPNGLFVLHRCDNPPCVNPAHLYLGTDADNVRDRVARNRSARSPGESNPRAKVTDAQALEIRDRFVPGRRWGNRKALALEFGISVAAVWKIAHGWRGVTR